MNIGSVIRKELEHYEAQMQEAAALYAEASAAIRAINELTNKLREGLENEANTDERMEKEVVSGT
jgi:hypothetical protein